MDKQAIHERARRVRRIERLTFGDWPPHPPKLAQAVEELLALSEAPQDQVQRAARERLVTACQAYTSRNHRANDDCAAEVRTTWHLFEMMWRDDRGRMIAPDFLSRHWKAQASPAAKSTVSVSAMSDSSPDPCNSPTDFDAPTSQP
jgi:hypothetical protein